VIKEKRKKKENNYNNNREGKRWRILSWVLQYREEIK
jgi:hypothetical protein